MRTGNIITVLVNAIRNRIPVLLTGEPGVGKTSLGEQAAALCNAHVILSHPVVADPTDAKGFPVKSEDGTHAMFIPFGDLYRALNATEPTVWILDDLGQATPAVQASFMQLLLARRINGHALPDCVTFLACTNRRTDRAGVSGILEPVKSRFGTILGVEAHIDDWCEWAFSAGTIPAEVIAFLRFRPDLLSAFTASADLTNSPTPRTWENASKVLALGLPKDAEAEALAGAVGAAAATEFLGFVKLYRDLPNIDAILIDPNKSKIPDNMASLYATVTALGMRANPETFPRLAVYAERLVNAGHGEFAALLLRDSIRRDDEITQTTAFVKLATGPLGQLISGTASE